MLYIIAKHVAQVFLILLFFLFVNGLLAVSAGAQIIKVIIETMHRKIFTVKFIFICKSIKGKPNNKAVLEIKQMIDLLA